MIGHCITNCNRIAPQEVNLKEKEHKGKKKTEKEAKKIFVQTKDGRVEQNKENEVINVEESNARMDNNIIAETSNNSKSMSSATKRTGTNNDTAIVGIVDAPSKPLPQQNMFAALVNDDDNCVSPDVPLIQRQNQISDNSNSELNNDGESELNNEGRN
jgi:microcompartment protein CcmK/EutM